MTKKNGGGDLHSLATTLEIIRHYIRLAFELNYFSQAQYKALAEQVNEIGRMTGGWLKSLKPENP